MDIFDGIITLAGVALGAAITLSADWVKLRYDRRQKYHLALFSLLDVYHALRRSDTGRADRIAKEVLKTNFPEVLNDRGEFIRLRLALIKMLNSATEKGTSSVEELEKVFQASVVALAPVDPWMAYTLSGRVDSLRNIKGIEDLLPYKTLTDEDTLMLQTRARTRLLQEVLQEVEGDIIKLSGELGAKAARRTHSILSALKGVSDEKLVEDLNGFMGKLMEEGESEFNDDRVPQLVK
ncbi:hypothetical protein [uncultured Pontibacter sp.]|uniref:hypothetical protein n=1 Tax=uncultured Pontibacter sp. TaxID=453356 RepID=UPI00262AC9A5|nr:hypothetical protein [uncultured Pontibacter sp.]